MNVAVDHEDTILRTFMLFVQTADAALKYVDARFFKAGLSTIFQECPCHNRFLSS